MISTLAKQMFIWALMHAPTLVNPHDPTHLYFFVSKRKVIYFFLKVGLSWNRLESILCPWHFVLKTYLSSCTTFVHQVYRKFVSVPSLTSALSLYSWLKF